MCVCVRERYRGREKERRTDGGGNAAGIRMSA